MGALAVIWAPVQTLGRAARERSVLAGFIVVAVYAAAGTVSSAINFFLGPTASQQLPQLPQGTDLPEGTLENIFAATQVIGIIFSVLWPFVVWAVIALVMQLVTRFFGGSGPLSAMFAAVGVALMPLALAAVISVPLTGLQAALGFEGVAVSVIGGISSLITFVAIVWAIVLIIIGASLAREVSYGESAGSCAISCAGCLGLIIAAVIVLVLIAALAGSVGAPQ